MIDPMVIIVIIVLYYIIKLAVKNGINESIIGESYSRNEQVIKNDEKLNKEV